MSRALLLVAFASLSSCRKQESAPPPVAAASAPLTGEAKKQTWTVYSEDGRSAVIQSYRAAGSCHLESAGAGAAWTLEQCLSSTMQLQFLSNDGKKLLIVDPMPEVKDTWRTTPVVWLYDAGKLAAFTTAGSLVRNDKKLDVVGHRFAWLAGTRGQPGTEPKYGDDGINGATVSGDLFHFRFDGSGIPPPLEAAAVTAPGGLNCGGMMEFTDDRGQKHFVENLGQVPLAFRETVHCTKGANIDTVKRGK
ncbi:MAG: hypothetical protein QM723_28025 [Myxococcaceae bacterium]